MTPTGFMTGDVLVYTSERADRWCREGMAVVKESSGKQFAVDTFWDVSGDNHLLTTAELSTASVEFNLADFEEVARYSHHAPSEWINRATTDRQRITSQHGLSNRWFIRLGSSEDRVTIRQNLIDAVDQAAAAVESAERSLAWAREELARFDAQVVDA